jgi:Domain of unknown function (DUF4268)/HNH endonuclease
MSKTELDKQEHCVQYWKSFHEYCEQHAVSIYSHDAVIRKPYRSSNAFMGTRGFSLGAYLGPDYLRIQVWIEIEARNRSANVEAFDRLKQNQHQIEGGLTHEKIILVWDANKQDDITRKIYCESTDFGLYMPKSEWIKSFEWIVAVTEAMNRAFSSSIVNVELSFASIKKLNDDDFRHALLNVQQRATTEQWNMLLGHAAAQDHALSMTEIAKLGGHQTNGTGNSQYEKLAEILAEELGALGLEQNMQMIDTAYANAVDAEHSQWEMHPQLVAALWQLAEPAMLAHTEQVVDVQHEFEVDPKLANITVTERSLLVQARIGQGAYRQSLMQYWNGQCAVTACPVADVLIASHIKPWSESENGERLDPFNGLLLIATLDKLFDRGLISFADDGNLLYDQAIELHLEKLGIKKTTCLRHIDERHKQYLENHRKRFGFV